jgi:HAD superfamily hydrolase (TIGR01490 family)
LVPIEPDHPSDADAPRRPPVTSEFAPAPDGAAAFFDLDRTLISGSSAFAFATAARKHDLMSRRQLVRDGLGALTFRLGGASDAKVDQVRERILRAVVGNRQADLMALNPDVVPRLLDKVRPEAKQLLELHHRAGRDTYIVSAAPQEIVGPFAEALGMTGGIGTVSEVVDGVYTGELAGPFCYGPGKVEAIKEMAGWEGFDLSRCYGYSDSASDLPMLEAVGHPVAVNPDRALADVATVRGWPVVVFHRKTRLVVKRVTAGVGASGLAAAAFAAGLAFGERRARLRA